MRRKRRKARHQGIDLLREQERARQRLLALRERPYDHCAILAQDTEDAQSAELTRAERAQRLQWLRSLPYLDYLKTPDWRRRRAAALRAASYRCQRCKNQTRQLDVHHLTYERRGHEWPTDLMVLCRPCHKRTHGL